MKVIKNMSLFVLMILAITVISKPASATTIADLQNKFPNGAYWNHVVQQGHSYVNYQDVGSCNNPDGYTWTPCGTHNGNVGIGGYDCNTFQNAMQCCGFAKKLAYDLYGSTHSSWGQTTVENSKPGDVIHYYGGGADANNGHWAMIIGRSGTTLTFGECNIGTNCKISWGRSINVSAMSSYTIYSAPHSAVGHNPEGCLDSVEGVTGGIRVDGWAFDRDNLSESIEIHVYIGGSASPNVECHVIRANTSRPDVNKYYSCGDNHGFSSIIPTVKTGKQEVWVYAINIGNGDNLCMGSQTVNIYHNPEGSLDAVEKAAGGIKVAGWGFDRDNLSEAIRIHVYIGGSASPNVECHEILANKERKDVDQAHSCGENHGFNEVIATNKTGQQDIYVYALNVANGDNICLGNRTINIISQLGDVYQDGKIDGKDVSLLLQYRLKKRELTEEQIVAGDVYADGKINGKDVSKLLQYRLGKISSLD